MGNYETFIVWCDGVIFADDKGGINEHEFEDWHDAVSLYDAFGDMIHITDNYYGISFCYGEWN